MGDTPRQMRIKFSMPSDPRYLCTVRGAIGPLAAAIGWSESECREIVLAIDEALANIIRHAYHGRTDGSMELECSEIPDGLKISLLDNGEAPDLSKICSQVDSHQPGGRGTHIIKEVMDEFSYQASPEGNRFVAIKRLRKRT